MYNGNMAEQSHDSTFRIGKGLYIKAAVCSTEKVLKAMSS